jgi:hypothetical protein
MLLSSFFQRRVTRMGGADVLSEGLALEADGGVVPRVILNLGPTNY